MNKMAKGLLGFIAWVWLVVSAVMLIWSVWQPEKIKSLLDYYSIVAVVGGVCAIAALLIPKYKLKGLRKRKDICFANSIGEISIALPAVEETLDRVLADIDIVLNHEIRISDSQNERKIKVKARVGLKEVNDLPSKVADIQQELKRRFDEIIPDADSEFYIKIVKINIPKNNVPKKEETSITQVDEESHEETDYFTGLKYPIEEANED